MPMGIAGAAIGIPGFGAIILSSFLAMPLLFVAGTFAIGLGAGLFGHATLTATMRASPPNQIGLSLGAWGAVQATAAGIGVALAGIIRDGIVAIPVLSGSGAATPYNVVFVTEAFVLLVAIAVAIPLARRARREAGSSERIGLDHNDSQDTVEVA